MKGYCKKQAKRYMETGYLRRGATVREVNWGDDWDEWEIVPTEWNVARAIFRLASRRGWNGNHWDNPLHYMEYWDYGEIRED